MNSMQRVATDAVITLVIVTPVSIQKIYYTNSHEPISWTGGKQQGSLPHLSK